MHFVLHFAGVKISTSYVDSIFIFIGNTSNYILLPFTAYISGTWPTVFRKSILMCQHLQLATCGLADGNCIHAGSQP